MAEAPTLDPADLPGLPVDGHRCPRRNRAIDGRHPANRPLISRPPPHFPHSQLPVSDHAASFKQVDQALASPLNPKDSVWDDRISGLGVCIYPSGVRSFFLRRQLPNGRVRSITFGPVDRLSLPEARKEARRVLPTLLDEPEEGGGPRYPGRPMSD